MDMAGKSIRDIALAVGVELTSKVEEGSFRAENVHKVLHNLAERYVKALEMSELAEIVGANPDLLGRRVPFNAVEGSFETALKDSLKWAIIEESAGYRTSAEAFVVHGKVLDTLAKFSERLKEKAAAGALAAPGVENVSVFVERVARRGYLDDIDIAMLKPIISQMGTYATRLRDRHAAATGIRPDHVRDPLLDTVGDLAFLVDRSVNVLVSELSEELREVVQDRGIAR
jgi:hypothetical protein